MKVEVKNFDGSSAREISLNPEVFDCYSRPGILNAVVHWQLAKRRAGTHQTKGRSDVACSTRKIYKQKGTGNARHGAASAPQFRSGGVTFGPHFRSYDYKLNKKVRLLALKIALSEKFRSGEIEIVENFALEGPKTNFLSNKLKNFAKDSILVIDKEISENLKKSSANLFFVDVLPTSGLNVYDIIRHKKVLLSVDAVEIIEKRFM